MKGKIKMQNMNDEKYIIDSKKLLYGSKICRCEQYYYARKNTDNTLICLNCNAKRKIRELESRNIVFENRLDDELFNEGRKILNKEFKPENEQDILDYKRTRESVILEEYLRRYIFPTEVVISDNYDYITFIFDRNIQLEIRCEIELIRLSTEIGKLWIYSVRNRLLTIPIEEKLIEKIFNKRHCYL